MSLSSTSSTSQTWEKKLQDKCLEARIPLPMYEEVSDKRGGRTAWSSRVIVSGQTISARFWYDVKYLHNAKEDVAEVAFKFLTSPNRPSSS